MQLNCYALDFRLLTDYIINNGVVGYTQFVIPITQLGRSVLLRRGIHLLDLFCKPYVAQDCVCEYSAVLIVTFS